MTTLPDPQSAFDVPSFRPEMAFPYFTEDMLRCIRGYGAEAEYGDGAQVSTAGQREADMFVVLTGSIQVYTNNAGFGLRNQSNSAPDECLRNEVGNITFRAHQPP